MTERRQRILEGQGRHVVLLAALLALVAFTARADAVRAGGWLGLGTRAWLALAVAGPIAHQTYVWLAWRLELYGRTLTRTFGERALRVHVVLFALFSAGRLGIVGLALANAGTLPGPPATWRVLGGLLFLPALYLFVSVHRHFGMVRATGADHFDPRWREPFVRAGIFRWTPNAMYVFGFLLMWAIAFAFASAAATVAAAYAHAYIWVHYLCTEKPDLRRIYAEG